MHIELKSQKILFTSLKSLALLSKYALVHCPLCTVTHHPILFRSIWVLMQMFWSAVKRVLFPRVLVTDHSCCFWSSDASPVRSIFLGMYQIRNMASPYIFRSLGGVRFHFSAESWFASLPTKAFWTSCRDVTATDCKCRWHIWDQLFCLRSFICISKWHANKLTSGHEIAVSHVMLTGKSNKLHWKVTSLLSLVTVSTVFLLIVLLIMKRLSVYLSLFICLCRGAAVLL